MEYDSYEYPVTYMVAAELADFENFPAVQQILEALSEYEHGSVDLDDVGLGGPPVGVTLEQYAAVALDLALVLVNNAAAAGVDPTA